MKHNFRVTSEEALLVRNKYGLAEDEIIKFAKNYTGRKWKFDNTKGSDLTFIDFIDLLVSANITKVSQIGNGRHGSGKGRLYRRDPKGPYTKSNLIATDGLAHSESKNYSQYDNLFETPDETPRIKRELSESEQKVLVRLDEIKSIIDDLYAYLTD